jgi:hypothetical protein
MGLGPPVCIKCVEVYSLEWPSGKWYCAVCGNQEIKNYYFTVDESVRNALELKYKLMDHVVKQAIKDLVCSAVFFRTYYVQNHNKLSLFANKYLNQMQNAISVLGNNVLYVNHTEESKGS